MFVEQMDDVMMLLFWLQVISAMDAISADRGIG
jgi:hypothetical protein